MEGGKKRKSERKHKSTPGGWLPHDGGPPTDGRATRGRHAAGVLAELCRRAAVPGGAGGIPRTPVHVLNLLDGQQCHRGEGNTVAPPAAPPHATRHPPPASVGWYLVPLAATLPPPPLPHQSSAFPPLSPPAHHSALRPFPPSAPTLSSLCLPLPVLCDHAALPLSRPLLVPLAPPRPAAGHHGVCRRPCRPAAPGAGAARPPRAFPPAAGGGRAGTAASGQCGGGSPSTLCGGAGGVPPPRQWGCCGVGAAARRCRHQRGGRLVLWPVVCRRCDCGAGARRHDCRDRRRGPGE